MAAAYLAILSLGVEARHSGAQPSELTPAPANAVVDIRDGAFSAAGSALLSGKEARGSCLVFHSMHKSAGDTMKHVFLANMQSYSKKHNMKFHEFDCDEKTYSYKEGYCPASIGPKAHKAAEKGELRGLFKGHTLTMAYSPLWSIKACTWITMFREPASRLVSAFVYCRDVSPRDPLCGVQHFNFHKQNLTDFAQHWSNFGFRELLLHPSLKDSGKLALSGETAMAATSSRPLWYQWKQEMGDAEDVHNHKGAANFKLLEHFWKAGPMFDYIGVVEQWEETMAFFDKILPFANGKSYLKQAAKMTVSHKPHGSNVDKYKAMEQKTLDEARRSHIIMSAMASDTKVYQQLALPFFKKQLKKAGMR